MSPTGKRNPIWGPTPTTWDWKQPTRSPEPLSQPGSLNRRCFVEPLHDVGMLVGRYLAFPELPIALSIAENKASSCNGFRSLATNVSSAGA